MSGHASGIAHRSRIRRQLGWQAVSNLGVAGIGGVYLIYLGRALGLREFGLYALITAITTFAFTCTDPRAHEAIVKFVSQWRDEPGQARHSLFVLFVADCAGRLSIWILLLVGAPIIEQLLLHGSAAGLLLIGATGTFASKLGNNAAIGVLRVFGKFDWQASLLISSWSVKLVVTLIAMTFIGPSVVAVLLIAYACDIAANVIAIAKAVRELKSAGLWATLRPRDRALHAHPQIKRFLLSGVGISLADSFVRELDTTVVGWSMPLETVGLYRMAKNMVLLVWRGLDPVCVVLMPEFAKLAAAGDYREITRIGMRATRLVFLVALIALLACVTLLPVAVPVVLGQQFSGIVPATTIMLVGLLIGAPLIWNYARWVAAGRLGVQLFANVLAGTLAGALFVILTPRFGLNGASVGFAVAISMPFVLSHALWRLHARRISST